MPPIKIWRTKNCVEIHLLKELCLNLMMYCGMKYGWKLKYFLFIVKQEKNSLPYHERQDEWKSCSNH